MIEMGGLAVVVRQERMRRHWSQADLAGEAKLTQAAVASIESGRQKGVTTATLAKLANAFEWEPGEFMQRIKDGDMAADELRDEGLPEATIQELIQLIPELRPDDRMLVLNLTRRLWRLGTRTRAEKRPKNNPEPASDGELAS